MDTVRLNITLPRSLVQQLDNLIRPRKKSKFIAETLKQRIEEIEKEELQKILEEGYKATKKESRNIAKEFGSIDLEGWDDY